MLMFRRALVSAVLAASTAAVGFAQDDSAMAAPKIGPALIKLDAYVRAAMKKTGVPGVAVAVVYKDQVVFLKGYGVRRIGSSAQVDADTVFEIASLSKPITSTILASLVGTGEVGWDSRIENLDPEFKLSSEQVSEQVTIRDFLSHRSGLPTTGGDILESLGYSRPEVLHQLRFIPLTGEFRKSYQYSNFGYTEAAIAAARKTGERWEDIAEERLYEKIGMHSTSSRFSDYANNPNKAALHYFEDGMFKNRFVREADAEAPAGGVSSNVRDLAQWMRLQLGEGSFNGQQVVSREALEETHTPQICRTAPKNPVPGECPKDQYYGLGWNVGKDAEGRKELSHSGAFLLGTGTSVYMLPSEQIGIVVLGNSTPIGLPEAVCLSFLDYFRYGFAKVDWLARTRPVFAELQAEAQASSPNYSEMKPPKNPSPGRPVSSYKGKYFNRFYGTLEISVVRNQLILRLPPRGAYYELTRWDGDTFTYYITGEDMGVARRGVKFLGGGKQVLIQNLAIVNSGIFTKVD